jgi:hypothetical protein
MENGMHTSNGSNDALQAMAGGKTAINGGGRCPANGTTKTLTPKELTTRKTTCPACAKPLVIKDNHFNEDFTGMTIPNHNLPKIDAPGALLAPTPSAPTQPPTVLRSPDGQVTQLSPPPADAVSTAPATSVSRLFKAEIRLETEDVVDFYFVASDFAEASRRFVALVTSKQEKWTVMSVQEVAGELIA